MSAVNVLIVGVGGQGTLLASRLLGNVAMENDFDVKVSEVHGMSQRGGSVVTYVRYGEGLYSPIIEEGQADYIVAFELLEALRYVHYLKPEGKVIVNAQEIKPMPVIIGAAQYPEDALGKLKAKCSNVIAVDALEMAKKCGSDRAVNTVLMGVLAKELAFSKEQWHGAMEQVAPQKFLALNLEAFDSGMQVAG
ncbi:indolepyruvate oxidoreductase subunit beta [Clostridia bacterium OttesenSCG-928-F22]|nr:indolepyruvate oxidoreductase subunit beta [Clostridia bacterium OttesenSCG-928-F22]